MERVRKVDRGHGEAPNVPTHSVKVVTLEWKKTGRAVGQILLQKAHKLGGAEGKMGKGVIRRYSRCDKSQQTMVTRARKRSRDRTRCLERGRQQSGGTHGLTGRK